MKLHLARKRKTYSHWLFQRLCFKFYRKVQIMKTGLNEVENLWKKRNNAHCSFAWWNLKDRPRLRKLDVKLKLPIILIFGYLKPENHLGRQKVVLKIYLYSQDIFHFGQMSAAFTQANYNTKMVCMRDIPRKLQYPIRPVQTGSFWRPNIVKHCLVTKHADIEVRGQTVKNSMIKHRSNS